MSKNKTAKKNKNQIMQPAFEENDELDFSNSSDYSCDMCDEMESSRKMEILLETDHFQSSLAFALTRLIAEHAPAEKQTEEHIFSSFVAAQNIVRENSALQSMMEKFCS